MILVCDAPSYAMLRSWFAIWFANGGRACRKVTLPEATMKGVLCGSLLVLLMTTTCAASLPGDSAGGKRLYDANCIGCHDTSVFTRKDRVVQSLDDLKKQLASCAHMAKKEFSESETQGLLKYLNDRFYHFR